LITAFLSIIRVFLRSRVDTSLEVLGYASRSPWSNESDRDPH
jgi:hypothetical protein